MRRDEFRATDHVQEVQSLTERLKATDITSIARRIVDASTNGRTVFVIGNGGSATTASHFVTDLTKNAQVDSHFVRARTLADNLALLTATANDLGYERIFADELRREGAAGDLLVAISGSGNSANVLQAAEMARDMSMYVIGLCGFSGGRLASLCDQVIVVDATCIEVVEDVHSVTTHAIARAVGEGFRELVPSPPRRSGIFLDRDGVINVRRPSHVRSWDEFQFVEGSLEALRRIKALNVPVIVTTNQAVIGRDGLPTATVDAIHQQMCAAIEAAGGRVDAVLVCPHSPIDSCRCRKPRPGLLYQAATDYDIDLSASVLIGDSESDMAAARAAGCLGVLVTTDVTRNAHAHDGRTIEVGSLLDAVEVCASVLRNALPQVESAASQA